MGGGVGIPGEKARCGGSLEGWPVQWRTSGVEWFRGGQGGMAAGAGGSASGGWRLRGVEVEDEP